jgi:hypothetical protein
MHVPKREGVQFSVADILQEAGVQSLMADILPERESSPPGADIPQEVGVQCLMADIHPERESSPPGLTFYKMLVWESPVLPEQN